MTINREDEWKIEGLEVTAPLDSDLYLSLEPLVNDVASKEWGNSHIYDMQDVAQAIWIHIMANWKEYEKADKPLVYFLARRAARDYCKQARIDYMYATGAFLYTPGIVRRCLESVVFCPEAEAHDIEARADITEAMEKLPRAQKAAIYKKFALNEPLTGPGEKTAESRGVTAITHRLNTGLRLRPEVLP